MHTPLTRTLFSLPLLALSLAACNDDPLDPYALADRMALQAREVVHQTGSGAGFAGAEDSGLVKLAEGLTGAGDGVAGMMPAPLPPGMGSAMGGSSMAAALAGMPDMPGMPSMSTTEEEFDALADDLRHWLRERVLADANLESRTQDEAVYRLLPDPTCRALSRDVDAVAPPIDAHCVDQLTRLQVRVAVRVDGDGGRLTVLIGPDRLELSTFVIHSDLLALEVDLAKANQATQVIDQTLGTDGPAPARFDALAGRVRLALHKDGERKVTGSFSVLEAINVSTLDAAGALGPALSLGASDPTLAVTADGVNQTLKVEVNAGAFEFLGSWNPLGTAAPNRDLHLTVGKLTGQITFAESSDELIAKGLGVGATTLDVHGARIFELALNPNDQQRFDLRVSLDAAGQPQIEVTPRFDLALGFHLGLVASELSEPPPAYLLDETYGIKFDNGGMAAVLAAVPATTTFAGGVRVTAGTLSVSSSAVASPVLVPAGRCLTGLPTAPDGTHPVLGTLSVTDCQ